jgi:hypothetical protein
MLTRFLASLTRPRRLAAVVLLFNLPFVIFRAQRAAYDTYTHIFFADHYRQNWWSLWEPRWYLGFSMASYPPLVHQLIALLSWPLNAILAAFSPEPEPFPGAFRWLSEEAAYVLVLLGVLCLFPFAVRSFARIFVGPRAAGWAALLGAVLPALHLTAWTFGQLPTLAATTFVLLALARGAHFLRSGNGWALAQAVALAGAAAATHHAAFLFVPFGALAIVLRAARLPIASPLHPRRAALIPRTLLWASLSALAVASVLWPFLAWSRGQSLQTPIDHASRYDFLAQPQAMLFFFWPIYGALVLIVPAAAWFTRRLRRRLWSLAAACALLFVLGLGGTTPLPRWLFGAGWEWLTYDRFGLWASICLLPFAGALLTGLVRGRRKFRTGLAAALILAMAATSAASGFLTFILYTQPPAIDLAPIVRFLDDPAQRPYRYLTLGFGDQFAKLTALTRNGTLDGTYHTARTLPELRSSGLGALDGALWNPQGVWALKPFLSEPQKYGLRWAFSNHAAYEPVLRASGWTFRFMVGEVQAWERADVTPVELAIPADEGLAARWWGAAPLLALAAVVLLWSWPTRRTWTRERIALGLAEVRTALFSLLVALLSLWWVHVLRVGASNLPQVYFTYKSVLVFASDVALILLLSLWALERLVRLEPLHFGPRPVRMAGLALIAACALSAWASPDRVLTLAVVVHLTLLAALYLMVINDPPGTTTLGLLFGGVVLAQSLVVASQVLTQSTASLRGLHLPWPGVMTVDMRGVSVVANLAGEHWLRAYGTLAHPNILGAMLLAYLGPAAERFLSTGSRRWLAVIGVGVLSLFLTFSRAAWLGLIAAGAALPFLLPRSLLRRGRGVLAIGAGVAVLAALPLLPFVTARAELAGQRIALERASTLERSILIGYGLEAWRAQPLTGVGAGAFVQWTARVLPSHYTFEPVHSLPLLLLAETGLLGGAALAGLIAAVAQRVWRRRDQATVAEAVWACVLLGVLVTSLFDHIWWTMPPARTLFVTVLALWARSSIQS